MCGVEFLKLIQFLLKRGALLHRADGTNSLIRLPVFTTYPGTSGALTFEVSNAGQIEMPLLTMAQRISFSCASGGSVPLAQLESLAIGGLTVSDGRSITFPTLTNLNGSDLSVSAGSALTFTALSGFVDNSGCCGAKWAASDSGSLLSFPALATLAGNPSWAMVVQASSGATIDLPVLSLVPNSLLTLKTLGAGSTINVPFLSGAQGGSGLLSLDAGAGSAITCSNLVSGRRVAIARRAGAILPFEQITSLALGSLTLEDGSIISLSMLTNFDGAALAIRNGSRVTLPSVLTFSDSSGCCGTSWEINGTNSLLSLPSLSSFAGNPTWSMKVNVREGGQLLLGSVATVPNSLNTLIAAGGGSLIDLSSLTAVPGGSGQLSLEATNGGTILLPNLVDGQRVGLTFRRGGSISAPFITQLLSLTIDGVSVTLPGVTNLTSAGTLSLLNAASLALPGVSNIDGQNLSVSGGSTLSLPGILTYRDTSGCCGALWTASGTNSALDLPALTNLTGQGSWATTIQALSGARIGLSAVRSIGAGLLRVLADGTNSIVDLTALESFTGPTGSLALEAKNTGHLRLGLTSTTLARTTMTIRTNSTVSAGSIALNSGSSLTGAGTLLANLQNNAEVRPTGPSFTIAGDYLSGPDGRLTFTALASGTNTGLSSLTVTGQVTLDGSLALAAPVYETPGNAYTAISNLSSSPIVGLFNNTSSFVGPDEGSFEWFLNVGDGNDLMLVRPFITLNLTNPIAPFIKAVAHDSRSNYLFSLPPGSRHFPGVGEPGVTVQLQATTDLAEWTNLITAISDSNGIIQTQDTSGLPRRFYRIRLP